MAQGYADHFVQDSFAPGHLANKTLVMQWFVEWAEDSLFFQVKDWDDVRFVTAANRRPLWGVRCAIAAAPGRPTIRRPPRSRATSPRVWQRQASGPG